VIRVSAAARGTYAALAVAILIVVLYVVLRPDEGEIKAARAADPTTSTSTSTTTLAPRVQLCILATAFAAAARDVDPNVIARLGETFYTQARELVTGDIRAEYDAAARYYTEYNAIGEPYDYDTERIAKEGDGERWAQLRQRPPLGVDQARADIAAECRVDLPAAPSA
jgi:hypothetical protein